MRGKPVLVLLVILSIGQLAYGQSRLLASDKSSNSLTTSLLNTQLSYSVFISPSFQPDCCLSVLDSCVMVTSTDLPIGSFVYDKIMLKSGKSSTSRYPDMISVSRQSLSIDKNTCSLIKDLFEQAIFSSSSYDVVPFQDGTSYSFTNPKGEFANCSNVSEEGKDNCSKLVSICRVIIEAVQESDPDKIAVTVPAIKQLTSSFKRLGSKPSEKKPEKLSRKSNIEQPVFHDDMSFSQWVNQRLIYPPQLKESDINGTVLVLFIISKEGDLIDIDVLSSPHPLMTESALSVLKQSPRWEPAKEARTGNPVDQILCFPIIFRQ